MGRLVTGILPLCLALWLVSCKTSSQLEEKKDIRFDYSLDNRTSGQRDIDIRDFLRVSILERLTGSAIVWSAPDSAGIQYKIADLNITGLKETDVEQALFLNQKDSITTEEVKQESIRDNLILKTKTKQDSRPFNLTTIIIILGISLLILFWFRFK